MTLTLSSIIKDKAGRVRKSKTSSFEHDCNGKLCSNCEVKFSDVCGYNAHLSLCNYKFNLKPPTMSDSPYEGFEESPFFPQLDIDFKMLLKGRSYSKKSRRDSITKWLKSEVKFTENICQNCTLTDCTGKMESCGLIKCLICNHSYCVLLLRIGSNKITSKLFCIIY